MIKREPCIVTTATPGMVDRESDVCLAWESFWHQIESGAYRLSASSWVHKREQGGSYEVSALVDK